MKQALDSIHNGGDGGGSRRQRGAVVVELALMLPFLVLIFLVVADLGLVLREHQILENAAREGARFSSLQKNWVDAGNPGATLATIQQFVVDYCAGEGITIDVGDVNVDQDASFVVSSGTTVDASEVTVSVDRELFLPSTLFFGSTTVNLTGKAMMRNFYGD